MTPTAPDERLREKYRAVHGRLQAAYGAPTWRQHLPPVDELVSTILSQSTSDTNRDRGFDALKARFGSWTAVMDAPTEAVADAIRPAGLANQKAPRIQAALRRIQAHNDGELSLDFLNELPLDDAAAWLMQLEGIGPKTAAIILLFAFNRPAFPVDTHVHRVTRRLGLIGPRVTAECAHRLLPPLGDPGTYYAFHLNIIRHGREVCLARRPRCAQCPLTDLCDHYRLEVAGSVA